MTHGNRESDSVIVPGKSSNKGRAGARTAERAEGRRAGRGEGARAKQAPDTGPGKPETCVGAHTASDPAETGCAVDGLWHHVYNVDTLRDAFYGLHRKAVAGIDGETWVGYEAGLEASLRDLSDRLKRGAYRAPPVVRTYIPKGDVPV